MSIPLDRLYHYIESIADKVYGDSVIIYRFWPNGSKNINDLSMLKPATWKEAVMNPVLYCADQEPLHFDHYQEQNSTIKHEAPFNKLIDHLNIIEPITETNFRLKTIWNQFEKSILIHSEQRSYDEAKYRANNFVPVYYWSHALIALDWFRYAEHEVFTKKTSKTFLIYNRAWSGTREYRLKFLDLIVRLGLQDHCQTSVSPIEPELGIHYETHHFKNPNWRPTNVLENFFPTSNAHSHYSADFDTEDYNSTDIDVVLETLFDDQRLHLTEKILRPIACAQPFILVGTHGSLEYLRSYGFKTFMHIWDERYDLIEDPEERLYAIADLMKQIANWAPWVRESKMAQAREIAEYNRRHFFSQEFFNQVVSELKNNLMQAFKELKQGNNGTAWLAWWEHLLTFPEIVEYINTNTNPSYPNIKDYRTMCRSLTNQ